MAFGKKANIDPETRFWLSVKSSADCWEWQGYLTAHGYGFTRIKGKGFLAHRLSWVWHYGAIPDGINVCHTCDNPRCVRPTHLFLGTQDDNVQDMIRKGRGGLARLTPEQVVEIRREYDAIAIPAGHTRKPPGSLLMLEKRFGVCKQTIRRIVARENWKHLQES